MTLNWEMGLGPHTGRSKHRHTGRRTYDFTIAQDHFYSDWLSTLIIIKPLASQTESPESPSSPLPPSRKHQHHRQRRRWSHVWPSVGAHVSSTWAGGTISFLLACKEDDGRNRVWGLWQSVAVAATQLDWQYPIFSTWPRGGDIKYEKTINI